MSGIPEAQGSPSKDGWLAAHHAAALDGGAHLLGALKLDKSALQVARVPVPQQQHILHLWRGSIPRL